MWIHLKGRHLEHKFLEKGAENEGFFKDEKDGRDLKDEDFSHELHELKQEFFPMNSFTLICGLTLAPFQNTNQ